MAVEAAGASAMACGDALLEYASKSGLLSHSRCATAGGESERVSTAPPLLRGTAAPSSSSSCPLELEMEMVGLVVVVVVVVVVLVSSRGMNDDVSLASPRLVRCGAGAPTVAEPASCRCW